MRKADSTRLTTRLALAAGTLLLAACQTPLPAPAVLPPPVPCPAITVHSQAWQESDSMIALTAVNAMCHKVGDNLSISLDAAFAANRVRPGAASKLPVPYTVIIVDTQGALLSHETFQTVLLFPAHTGNVMQHEHLHQVVPVGAGNTVPGRLIVELGSGTPADIASGNPAP